jgi:hypothetical protein
VNRVLLAIAVKVGIDGSVEYVVDSTVIRLRSRQVVADDCATRIRLSWLLDSRREEIDELKIVGEQIGLPEKTRKY